MNTQELRFAQKALYSAGRNIGDAGMRLRGTEYGDDFEKLWNALNNLNNRLINDIRG